MMDKFIENVYKNLMNRKSYKYIFFFIQSTVMPLQPAKEAVTVKVMGPVNVIPTVMDLIVTVSYYSWTSGLPGHEAS